MTEKALTLPINLYLSKQEILYMKNQELNEAYELVNNVVKNKIRILIEEDLHLYEQDADILHHYSDEIIEKVMQRITKEQPYFEVVWNYSPKVLELRIQRKK